MYGLAVELRGKEGGVHGRESPTLAETAVRGVTRQIDKGVAWVQQRGGTVGREYPEPNVSSFKRRWIEVDGERVFRVHRPDLKTMLADLRRGAANGGIDFLVVEDLDRLTRDHRLLEDCIDAVRDSGRPIYEMHEQLDLSTPAGQRDARRRVDAAYHESLRKQERTRDARAYMAAQGVFYSGWPAHGWRQTMREVEFTDRYGNTVRRLMKYDELDPETAPLWQEAAQLVLSGVGANTLAKLWWERKYRTPRGAPWRAQVLRERLLSPRMAGYSVTDGQAARDIHTGALVVSKVHEPMFDVPTWEAVCTALRSHPSNGKRSHEGGREYQLSGIIVCGLPGCGALLYGNGRWETAEDGTRVRLHRYSCARPVQGVGCGGTSIDGQVADEFAAGLVLNRHARMREAVNAEPFPQEEKLARLHKLKDALWANLGDEPSEEDLADVQAASRRFNEQIKELTAARTAHLRAHARTELAHVELASTWGTLTNTEKRLYCEAVFEYVQVLPHVLGGSIVDRLVPKLRDDGGMGP